MYNIGSVRYASQGHLESFVKLVDGAVNSVSAVGIDAIQTVGSGFMAAVSEGLSAKNLTFSTIRHAFFGLRVPFIYLEYFVHDAVNDTPIALLGNILYLFGEVGLGAQWLAHLELIDLGFISSALGKSAFLSSLGISAIDGGLGIVSGIASVLYSVDYIIKLSTEDLGLQEKVGISFGLAASLVHVLALVIFFASAGVLFHVAMGLTLASVALYMTYWFLQRVPEEYFE